MGVAKTQANKCKIAAAIVDVSADAEKARVIRNSLAHSVYFTTQDGSMGFLKNILGGRGAAKKETLSVTKLKEHNKLTKGILDRLMPVLENMTFKTKSGHAISWLGRGGLSIQDP